MKIMKMKKIIINFLLKGTIPILLLTYFIVPSCIIYFLNKSGINNVYLEIFILFFVILLSTFLYQKLIIKNQDNKEIKFKYGSIIYFFITFFCLSLFIINILHIFGIYNINVIYFIVYLIYIFSNLLYRKIILKFDNKEILNNFFIYF